MNIGQYLLDLAAVVVPGALTIALGALIVWGVARLAGLAGGGVPDFVLRRASNGEWWLTRTRWRRALDVAKGTGTVGSSGTVWDIRIMSDAPLGDWSRGQRAQVALDGQQIYFMWITGGRRWYSQSLVLNDDVREHKILRRPDRQGVSTV